MTSPFDSLTSRRALLLATLGGGLAAFLAACTGRSASEASTTPSPQNESAAVSPTPASIATPACVVTPTETEGPYFVDEGLNRADIATDPSDGSVRAGAPLSLTFVVARVSSTGCAPLEGAQVDVWHCDAAGIYSDVSAQASVGKRFLRGYQVTDKNGIAMFSTIYPGWYTGRAVHIHFKVRMFSGAAKTYEFTSQLFFDDAVTDTVYQKPPYSSRPNRDIRNANDMVYTSNGNSGARLLASVAPSGTGYASSFAIGLNPV